METKEVSIMTITPIRPKSMIKIEIAKNLYLECN